MSTCSHGKKSGFGFDFGFCHWVVARPVRGYEWITATLPEDLAGREGDVQEEDDAGLPVLGGILLPVAEQLGQEHQVVVVHPHHVVAVPPPAGVPPKKKKKKKKYSGEATNS